MTYADGKPSGPPVTYRLKPEDYWRGVPRRYRHPDRFIVQREIHLQWPAAHDPTGLSRSGRNESSVRVIERGTGVIVWER